MRQPRLAVSSMAGSPGGCWILLRVASTLAFRQAQTRVNSVPRCATPPCQGTSGDKYFLRLWILNLNSILEVSLPDYRRKNKNHRKTNRNHRRSPPRARRHRKYSVLVVSGCHRATAGQGRDTVSVFHSELLSSLKGCWPMRSLPAGKPWPQASIQNSPSRGP